MKKIPELEEKFIIKVKIEFKLSLTNNNQDIEPSFGNNNLTKFIENKKLKRLKSLVYDIFEFYSTCIDNYKYNKKNHSAIITLTLTDLNMGYIRISRDTSWFIYLSLNKIMRDDITNETIGKIIKDFFIDVINEDKRWQGGDMELIKEGEFDDNYYLLDGNIVNIDIIDVKESKKR